MFNSISAGMNKTRFKTNIHSRLTINNKHGHYSIPTTLFKSWAHFLVIFLGLLSFPAFCLESDASKKNIETPYLELLDAYPLDFGVNLDLAVTNNGIALVSDPKSSKIWRLDSTSKLFAPLQITQAGRPYRFNPLSISIDWKDRLWIINSLNQEIIICSPQGQIISTIDRYQSGIKRPVRMDIVSDQIVSVWDDDEKEIIRFQELNSKMVIKKQLLRSSAETAWCRMMNTSSKTSLCLDKDKAFLFLILAGKSVRQFYIPDFTGETYARVGDVLTLSDNCLLINDAASHRIFFATRQLEPTDELLLYRGYLKTPRALFLQNGTYLWIVDEGRQELLKFRLRMAINGIEHALLGEEFLSLGYNDAALREVQRAGQGGGYPKAQLDLLTGRVHYQDGRFEQALSAFIKAARSDQSDAPFWQGNTLFQLNRYKEAVQAYQAALATFTDKAIVYYDIGQTYLSLKEWDLAIKAFSNCLYNDPEYTPAVVGMGRAYIENKQYDKAKHLFTQVSQKREFGLIGEHYLGMISYYTKDYIRAISQLSRAAEKGPYYREALTTLKKAYRKTGQKTKVRDTAQMIAQLKQAGSNKPDILEERW